MAFTKGDPRINRQGRPPSTNHLELRKAILKGVDILRSKLRSVMDTGKMAEVALARTRGRPRKNP